jgi:hypothetical protein
MLVGRLVTVIRFNDLIEERCEGVVRIVRSSIDSDAGVSPLRSREDALLEGESKSISSIFACFPNLGSKAFLEKRSSSSWEERKRSNVRW